MEVILKQGDVLNIPEGCNATIDGNTVIIEQEQKEFKRGDVLASGAGYIILVDTYNYESYTVYSFAHLEPDGSFCPSPYDRWNGSYSWRLATEEEKQQLFDKMKENGLRWNAEAKKVEKIRWRAENEGKYYFINPSLYPREDVELTSSMDDNRWNAFNYFQTEEQAMQAAERVKETLKKFHKENN